MITISNRNARLIVRMLGQLQEHLESAIETALVPCTGQPMEQDKANVAADRRDWRRAETLIAILTARKRKPREASL